MFDPADGRLYGRVSLALRARVDDDRTGPPGLAPAPVLEPGANNIERGGEGEVRER